jgi:alpha-lytic endopeptidase
MSFRFGIAQSIGIFLQPKDQWSDDMKTLKLSVRKTSIAYAIALVAASAAGAATASDVGIRLDPRMATALKRDLNLSPAQFGRYFQKQKAAHGQSAQAERQFGDSFGGGWFERDSNGEYHFVVGTTSVAKQASIDGAEVRQVRHSLRQLDDAIDHLNKLAHYSYKSGAMKGIQSWGIDLRSNSVVISLSPGATMRAVEMVANSPVDAGIVRFETTPGVAMTASGSFNIFGGMLYSSTVNGRLLDCSVGFSVVRWDGTRGFVTAGHCGGQWAPTSINGTPIGQVIAVSYPGNDYALVNVRNSDVLYGYVLNYAGGFYPVRGSAVTNPGGPICRSGHRSGFACGDITKINVSTSYGDGLITGLRESNVCVTKGDSGGSWITADQAQGVSSGGELDRNTGSNCGWPRESIKSWYQRINPVLSAYGLSLVTG